MVTIIRDDLFLQRRFSTRNCKAVAFNSLSFNACLMVALMNPVCLTLYGEEGVSCALEPHKWGSICWSPGSGLYRCGKLKETANDQGHDRRESFHVFLCIYIN